MSKTLKDMIGKKVKVNLVLQGGSWAGRSGPEGILKAVEGHLITLSLETSVQVYNTMSSSFEGISLR